LAIALKQATKKPMHLVGGQTSGWEDTSQYPVQAKAITVTRKDLGSGQFQIYQGYPEPNGEKP
jgi:hypothetical protein